MVSGLLPKLSACSFRPFDVNLVFHSILVRQMGVVSVRLFTESVVLPVFLILDCHRFEYITVLEKPVVLVAWFLLRFAFLLAFCYTSWNLIGLKFQASRVEPNYLEQICSA